MYTIGNTITFNSFKGNLTGTLLKLDAYPLIDLVTLNDGLIITAYELATGMELMNSQSFTLDDFVMGLVIAFSEKNFNPIALFKRLKSDADTMRYGSTNRLHVVNDSPSYNNWLQSELIRIENLPLLYNNEELAKIDDLILKANEYNLKEFALMLRCEKVKKSDQGMIKSSVDFMACQVEDLRVKQSLSSLAEEGLPYPTGVCHLPSKYVLTWDGMDQYLNEGRKRFLSKHIPHNLIQKFFNAYLLMGAINNAYGYYRCKLDYARILRIAIDNQKKRNIDIQLNAYNEYLNARISEMKDIIV
jgi:hypothetical protein